MRAWALKPSMDFSLLERHAKEAIFAMVSARAPNASKTRNA
jgi:hypothetical protein